MLSLALDNFHIVVVDVDIQRVVRLFTAAHTNTVTDMVRTLEIFLFLITASLLRQHEQTRITN